MTIIEYEDQYLEDVRDLLVELGEYIVSIDQDELEQVHTDYRIKMTEHDFNNISNYDGKCYLAIEEDKAIGLIMGTIRQYETTDYLDYKCPKEGEITELIVTLKTRSKGVGQALMNKMEEYFKSVGCEYVIVDVFAYNKNGISFYDKQGYHARMHTEIKKLD